MGRNDSESPPRGKRSPVRRERSPPRHKSSHTRDSQRERSPKRRPKSRSPSAYSPVVEKSSSRIKSPRRKRSSSPAPPPVKERTSSQAPRRRKSISPASRSPVREKLSSRARSPKRTKSMSPESRSPSPRSKRLKRVHAEREADKASEREQEKNHSKRGDKSSQPEMDSDKEVPSDRRDRRSVKNGVDSGTSRSRRGHSPSTGDNPRRSRHRSRSPYAADKRSRDEVNMRGTEQRNGDDDSVARMKAAEEALEAKEKQKPSFELSGKLAAETNRVRGVTLLFTEPPDAGKPDVRWRLYVFKAGEVLNEPLYIHRQTSYLFGRERRVADIPTDHPSCSKQHAVLQYRKVEVEKPDGTSSKQVRPYLMDLGSTNGTFINEDRIEPQRYYELFEKDTIKFGNSSREYVMLHENSAA